MTDTARMTETMTDTARMTGVAAMTGAMAAGRGARPGFTTASAAPDSTTTEETTTRPVEYRYDGGDHERFSHFVPREEYTRALVEGTPVRALCGKLWVPSRDPERFPICPQCKEINESLPE